MEYPNHMLSTILLFMFLATLFISPTTQNSLPEKSCATGIERTCAVQIVESVFDNKGHVDQHCCKALVGLGRECHDAWVNARLVSGGYEKNATQILKKSADAWGQCAPAVESGDPLECARNMNAICGREIVMSIFYNTGVMIEPCCEQLMGIGRECHNTLVNALLLPGGHENNATQILKKSLQVWNSCSWIVKKDYPLKCHRVKDDVCGKQIVNNVFHNIGRVTKTCCHALMDLGKGCHETLVNKRIISGGYEKNATKVVKRSTGLWNDCTSITKSSPTFECARMKDETCGNQIFMRVFHKKGRVNSTCCAELVERGKGCHDTLVNKIISSDRFEKNATSILNRSLKVWIGCSTFIRDSSPVCTRMKDHACRKQIFTSIFKNNGQVTEKCCNDLLQSRKECHDALVDNYILSKRYKNNSTEILKRSSDIWAHCASNI